MDEPENNLRASDEWIHTILKLLKDTDEDTGKEILERCGRNCYSESGMPQKIKQLKSMDETLSIEEKLEYVQKHLLGQQEHSPRIYYKDGIICMEYSKCLCSIVSEEHKHDGFLCECTRGFAKSLMESVFGTSAEVTIKKTILRGDDICLLHIKVI